MSSHGSLRSQRQPHQPSQHSHPPQQSQSQQSQSQQRLAEEVARWANAELQYSPGLTSEQLAPLCRGNMQHVWQYLVDHVRSEQNAAVERGNARLNAGASLNLAPNLSSDEAQRRKRLAQRRGQLQAEIAQTRDHIARVRQETAVVKSSLQQSSVAVEAASSEISQVRQRQALLAGYSAQVEHIASSSRQVIAQLAEQRQAEQARAASSSSETALLARSANTAKASHGSGTNFGDQRASNASAALESAATRVVREACARVEEHLILRVQSALKTNTGLNNQHATGTMDEAGARNPALSASKARTWQAVEYAAAQLGPSALVRGLTGYVASAITAVQAETDSLDFDAEAQEYRKRFLGEEDDLKRDLKGVHDRLQELQSIHSRIVLETMQARLRSVAHDADTRRSTREIQARLLNAFSGDATMQNLLAESYRLDAHIAGLESKCQFLRRVFQQQHEQIISGQPMQTKLEELQENIADLTHSTTSHESLIQALLVKTKAVAQQVAAKQAEISSSHKDALMPSKLAIDQSTRDLQNFVQRELAAFQALPLALVRFSQLPTSPRTPVAHLSVHRLQAHMSTASLQAVLQHLDIPWYFTPERVLELTIDKANHLVALQDREGATESSLRALQLTEQQLPGDTIDALVCRAEEWFGRCAQDLTPQLKRHLIKAREHLQACQQTQTLIQEWWEQPAQYAAPWLSVEQRNIQEWSELWTKLANRLRQLSGTNSAAGLVTDSRHQFGADSSFTNTSVMATPATSSSRGWPADRSHHKSTGRNQSSSGLDFTTRSTPASHGVSRSYISDFAV
ncbi:hypothetical protein CAOG_03253 [Capsaspora owczarzaki ATCC 30864]|uniref:Uncharacterized protein n=1 Tax=Capsaspora owczarzaki (strain ATCC 30864) TaxID=595528 RepID=A0A0D2X2B1_CAPO3|nr:hypothetical protein CAOG_03253 [Capsaspora owczarzaki ATCC 30864]KJE92249.1 hypothetical protein CAOG_003253 [Capsaspora owczarzaki ATCC 30864]|eukprot:XP_004364092.2 hypothetical protein CAOG_03253 [Capsaspora owczarzaki ATCC 30864]